MCVCVCVCVWKRESESGKSPPRDDVGAIDLQEERRLVLLVERQTRVGIRESFQRGTLSFL